MARSEIYTHFLLTHPRAFLLMSYFHLVAKTFNTETFSFKTDELQTVGHKPVLTPQQVRQALIFLKKRGYVTTEKHSYIPHCIRVTILQKDFPYV